MSDVETEAKDPTRLTHKQAVNRLKDIKDELERIHGKPQRSEEDDRLFAEMVVEAEVLDKHVRTLERAAALKKVQAIVTEPVRGGSRVGVEHGSDRGSSAGDYDSDPVLNPDSVQDHRFRNPWDLSEVRTFGQSEQQVGQELRARALSAIEKMSGASDKVRSAATDIVEQFDDSKSRISRMCLATSSPEYLRAWSKLAMGRQSLISPEEQKALERAMSLTDSAGGFLVPFQLDPTVIISSTGSRNDIRQVARTVVATGDVWSGVSAGATAWSWDAEGAEVSDDTSTFTQPQISLHKAAGFVPISIEAYEDEANVTQEVGRLLAFGKDALEGAAFATGTGSGQPFGIVTALAGTASEINAAADDTFAIGDVYTIQGALPARHRAGAAWLANNSIYNLIRRFDTQGGAGLWTTLGNDRPGELLGRPALEAEGMDGVVTTTGAVSNFILIYGDFSNYVIADRVGMTVEFIPHLFHTTSNRPSGSRGWYAYYRVGADSVLDDAFRLLDVASAA